MKPLARKGVWQVDCPVCHVPVAVELKQTKAACGYEEVCPEFGKAKDVEWPKDIDEIEKLLRATPPGEQNYHPIWTAKEFKKILADPGHTVGS